MDMVISAYNYGDEWLGELLDHIRGNIEFAINYINENLPKIKVKKPEATYLLWLDFREYNLTDKEITDKLIEAGGVAINMGGPFLGAGFGRLNVACPKYMLVEGLERLKEKMNSLI
jgi:cystathionine beta-lyase